MVITDDPISHYRSVRAAYYAAVEREDAAFVRWFERRERGENTNGGAAARLRNQTNYLSADLAVAQGELYALEIDPHEIDRMDGVAETPLGA